MLIHVGYHKTGTTFLQHHFFHHRRRGFFAPWTVASGEAIRYFVRQGSPDFNPQAVAQAFQAALLQGQSPPGAVPVLSHEDLCGHPIFGQYYGFRVADRLKATFPQAKILITIREQRDTLRSLYGQYLYQDGRWPLSEFLLDPRRWSTLIPPICRLDHLEYHHLVGYYAQLFGRDALWILPQEWLRRDPRGALQGLQDFAGTGWQVTGEYPPIHGGWGAATLALRRWLNGWVQLPPSHDFHRPSPPLWEAKNRLCRLVDRTLPQGLQTQVDRRWRRYVAEVVGDRYQASNQRLQAYTPLNLRSLGYDLPPDGSNPTGSH